MENKEILRPHYNPVEKHQNRFPRAAFGGSKKRWTLRDYTKTVIGKLSFGIVQLPYLNVQRSLIFLFYVSPHHNRQITHRKGELAQKENKNEEK